MKNSRVQLLCKISMLATVAACIMYFDVSLPFLPTFYKLDFSETVVLLSGFALGPIPAVLVEALKNIIILILKGTSTAGVGEIANFIMGCSFILPATIIYHKSKSKKTAMKGMAFSIISLCIVSAFMNYFVLLPVYAYFFQMPMDGLVAMGTSVNASITDLFTLIVLAVIPFNILKGSLNAILVTLVYKKVSPILKR